LIFLGVPFISKKHAKMNNKNIMYKKEDDIFLSYIFKVNMIPRKVEIRKNNIIINIDLVFSS